MRIILILLFLFSYYGSALAHGGEDHGDEKHQEVEKLDVPTKSETISETIKLEKIDSTKEGSFKFEISYNQSETKPGYFFRTKISEIIEDSIDGDLAVEEAKLQFEIKHNKVLEASLPANYIESGVYEFDYSFKDSSNYEISLNLTTKDNIKASVTFPITLSPTHNSNKNWLWYGLLLIFLIISLLFYLKLNTKLPSNLKFSLGLFFSIIISLFIILSTTLINKLNQNSKPLIRSSEGKAKNLLEIPKETQKIFNFQTEEVKLNKIDKVLNVSGLIKFTNNSKAEIISTINGKVKLSGLTLGQKVSIGTELGVVEPLLTANENIDLTSNILNIKTKLLELENIYSRSKVSLRILSDNAIREKNSFKALESEWKSNLNKLTSQLNSNNLILSQDKKLYDIGSINQKKLQESELKVKVSELELEALKKQKIYLVNNDSEKKIQEAELELVLKKQEFINTEKQIDLLKQSIKNGISPYFSLKSPLNGVVDKIWVSQGESVKQGDKIVSVINVDKFFLEARVFEKDLSSAINSTKASFRVSSYPQKTFSLDYKSAVVGNSIDPELRTITITYQVDNKAGLLKDGMFSEIQLIQTNPQKFISVPLESISKEFDQTYVYVEKGINSFEKRLVTLGIQGEQYVEIKKGLSLGEKVITNGVPQLKATSLKIGK